MSNENDSSLSAPSVIEQLRAGAEEMEGIREDWRKTVELPSLDAAQGRFIILLRQAAAEIVSLSTAREEAVKAAEKCNHWHRRAQKAEAELCVTAEERARQGMSIGRSLAGATWHHYKDRAEAAESARDTLRAQLDALKRDV